MPGFTEPRMLADQFQRNGVILSQAATNDDGWTDGTIHDSRRTEYLASYKTLEYVNF